MIKGLLVVLALSSSSAINNRPVIGIMVQPTDASLAPYGSQYLVASYVQWLESGGSRVVPILYNHSKDDLSLIFSQISGLVLPGGHCGTHNAYGDASWYLMELAVAANKRGDFFPVWGTCQGFQQVVQFGSGAQTPSVLHTTAGTEDLLVPVNFTGAGLRSRLMAGASPEVVKAMATLPVTVNLHHYSALTRDVEAAGSALHAFFEVVSNNHDQNGLEFVSLIEGRELPFYGSQFHPEKNAFEWSQGWERNNTDGVAHSALAVAMSEYLLRFFVSEARRSPHCWSDTTPPFPLIYAFNSIDTSKSPTGWAKCYVW